MYNIDVGKTIISSNGNAKGIITRLTERYCGGCGHVGPVYSVKWEDGRRTYPCPAGCKNNADGTIQII